MKNLFFVLVLCTIWVQMAYGDVGLISGTDASNVVVSGTSWTADFKRMTATAAGTSGTATAYSNADVSLVGGGDYRYATYGWVVDTPTSIKIIEDNSANVHVYINDVDIFGINTFSSTIDGNNLLQITLTDYSASWGGGWSLSTLSVNDKLLDGSWSSVGVGTQAQPVTFYVDLSGSSFNSAQFTAKLNYSSINSIPWGEGTDILVSSVKAVPEPSSFILVVISGIALLVLKKKPLRSS